MNVELRPHVADDGTEFDQNLVMVDGRQVGWIGNREDSNLVFLPSKINLKLREEIRQEVSKIKQRDVAAKSPPELPTAAEIKQAIDDAD